MTPSPELDQLPLSRVRISHSRRGDAIRQTVTASSATPDSRCTDALRAAIQATRATDIDLCDPSVVGEPLQPAVELFECQERALDRIARARGRSEYQRWTSRHDWRLLRRSTHPGAGAGSGTPPDTASVVVEALLDELLLHRPTVRVEAGELEVLLELEVHVVLATAVLLDRDDDPVAEALRLVRVELDVDLGDDVVLLVEDQDDVGLVVDRRRAAQVEVAQARRLEAFLVGGDDRRPSARPRTGRCP